MLEGSDKAAACSRRKRTNGIGRHEDRRKEGRARVGTSVKTNDTLHTTYNEHRHTLRLSYNCSCLTFFRDGLVGTSLASQDFSLGHCLLPLLAERSSSSLFLPSHFWSLYEVSYHVPAELSLAHQLSSAAPCSAMQYCAVLRAWLNFVHTVVSSYQVPAEKSARFTSSAQLSSAM